MADQTPKTKDEDCESLDANKKAEDKIYKHPDVDGGWAWFVAIGMATFYFSLGGFFRSFGVVFAAILNQFGQSASLTSLIPAFRAICLIFLGPAGTILSQRLTERVVIVTGAIIVSTGFIISFFATNLEFLIFSIGVMPGIGVSFIVGPANIMLGRYFDKRRARAITVASSVGCIGQIVVPVIMVNMIEAYSVQGALLIYGGIVLHVILTGLIMKPIQLQQSTEESESETCGSQRKLTDCNSDVNSTCDFRNTEVFGEAETKFIDGVTKAQLTPLASQGVRTPSVAQKNSNELDLQPAADISGSGSLKTLDQLETVSTFVTKRTGHACDATEVEMEPLTNQTKSRSIQISLPRTIFGILIRFVREMYPIELLLNVEYCLLLCSTTCSLAMLTCQQNYLFAMTESLGFSQDQSAIFLSIFGFSDMIGRLTSGQLSDRKFLPPQYVMATSCFISGVAFCFVPLAFSIYAIVPLIITIGCFMSVNLILAMPLMVETIGLTDFPKAFSMLLACHGIFASVFPPLFGMVKDVTGKFDGMFPISGGMQILAGILLIVGSFIRKVAKRRAKQRVEHPDSETKSH